LRAGGKKRKRKRLGSGKKVDGELKIYAGRRSGRSRLRWGKRKREKPERRGVGRERQMCKRKSHGWGGEKSTEAARGVLKKGDGVANGGGEKGKLWQVSAERRNNSLSHWRWVRPALAKNGPGLWGWAFAVSWRGVRRKKKKKSDSPCNSEQVPGGWKKRT